MTNIDKYARECHALVTVEKQVPPDAQSREELLCARIVELLDLVEDRDVEIAGLKKIRKRNERRMGEMTKTLGDLEGNYEAQLERIRVDTLPKPHVGGMDD